MRLAQVLAILALTGCQSLHRDEALLQPRSAPPAIVGGDSTVRVGLGWGMVRLAESQVFQEWVITLYNPTNEPMTLWNVKVATAGNDRLPTIADPWAWMANDSNLSSFQETAGIGAGAVMGAGLAAGATFAVTTVLPAVASTAALASLGPAAVLGAGAGAAMAASREREPAGAERERFRQQQLPIPATVPAAGQLSGSVYVVPLADYTGLVLDIGGLGRSHEVYVDLTLWRPFLAQLATPAQQAD